MSNFEAKTKHPITGKLEDAVWLDNYYGEHHYGVQFFSDWKIFDADVIHLNYDGKCSRLGCTCWDEPVVAETRYAINLCKGVHCKCMNLDQSCSKFHYGDHLCPTQIERDVVKIRLQDVEYNTDRLGTCKVHSVKEHYKNDNCREFKLNSNPTPESRISDPVIPTNIESLKSEISHIIGSCMCKPDMPCWFWTHVGDSKDEVVAIVRLFDKYAKEQLVRAYRDFQTVAIPETNDYANGWNDCRKRVRADLNYLAEFEENK